ncbi:hypothetical protein PMPD1_3646 [Paramixta manurensis]|uniref:Uncharacterized protein n=1 Tax=Paramixta manurensis TaxID=2740817 RepID=A0A6M8UI30_9GAMM|nr:hypothetical protein PMPD1_3646 [Erwiniaceae bacterium PD-1]
MDVDEDRLLLSGFSYEELQLMKYNAACYDETLGEVVQLLANRFRALILVYSGCLLVFLSLLLFSVRETIIGGGISLFIAVVIVFFMQPPVLSYKAWRYWRANRR